VSDVLFPNNSTLDRSNEQQRCTVGTVTFSSPGAVGLDLDPTDKVFFFTDSGSPGGPN